MIGAREYATLFKTGQYGRFYFVSGEHARGKTFRIFILPAGIKVTAPLNQDAVEVYGIINGDFGWTEQYGWLYEGRWQNDFMEMVNKRKAEIIALEQLQVSEKSKLKCEKRKSDEELLSSY